MTEYTAATNEEMAAQMGKMIGLLHSSSIKPVVFTPMNTFMPGITAEYLKDGSKVKMHFFCDGPFPASFGPALKEMAGLVGHAGPKSVICDYTPEVKRWYFEFCPTAVLGTDSLMRLFARRLADLVTPDAEQNAR